MNTDKYHQGERMECKTKAYLHDQDCQEHDAEDGSQDILQDEDDYDYQGHEDGSQDIPQDDEGGHDYQDNDDEGDNLYYRFIKDILHDEDEDNQKERSTSIHSDREELHSQDDQQGSASYNLYDQQESDQEGSETHDQEGRNCDSTTGADNASYISWM